MAAYVGDLAGLYVGAFAYEQEIMPVPGPGDDPRGQIAAYLRSLPADHFPNTVALADEMVAGEGDDRFEWGMDVLIRGLASYLQVPPDPRDRWPAPGAGR